MKNTIAQESSKELAALRKIIKPSALEAVIILHPQNHIKIYQLVRIADEHQLLQQLLTPQVLTPLVVNSCDINDFYTILNYAYFSNTAPQTLLNQIFDIEVFKSAIINHLTDTKIIDYLHIIIRDYPTIINKLPIADILSPTNIDLLSNTFIALLKNSDNSEIVLNYCNFNNPVHKEAFEAMMLSSLIPETARTELLRIVLESGEQFSYIDAPHISCNKEHFLPIIQKVIDNVYTKLNPQDHQKLADNINIGLKNFYGINLLITDIIKYGLSKHPIYIGTGEHNIPGKSNEVGISSDFSIQLKDGHLFLDLFSTKDPNFANILDTLIHEATHTACREFFANDAKPYSKQISRPEEQKFAELYNTLVRQTPISTVLSPDYHSVTHEAEFIARFIGQYTYYCVEFKVGSRAISFQEFAPQYLYALQSTLQPVEQCSAEEQQETGRLLQQFAEYLDNSQGFIKSAHNSLQKLEEIAAIDSNIDDASVEVTEAILELMGSDNYGDHI